jgi:hypothetical protein
MKKNATNQAPRKVHTLEKSSHWFNCIKKVSEDRKMHQQGLKFSKNWKTFEERMNKIVAE